MLHKTIPLREGSAATLTTYIHDQSSQGEFQIQNRPAIIVMPGGAYAFLSDTEAEPVALTFLKEGYNTFVLRYSVGDACTYPEILEEVSLAIWQVRSHAKEWYTNPEAIVVMGFSAGACLAAMLCHPVEHPRSGGASGPCPGGHSAQRGGHRLRPLGQHQHHSKEPGVLQPRCGENRQGLHPGAGLHPLRRPPHAAPVHLAQPVRQVCPRHQPGDDCREDDRVWPAF